MNLRPVKPEEPTINLTPLIDVVFLLLIFFMVSTTFNDDARLRLELPRASGESAANDPLELIQVVVDAGGNYYVDDRMLADARISVLKQALLAAADGDRTKPIVIKADANATHQSVMGVLDAAGQLGLVRVAFAASQMDDLPTPMAPLDDVAEASDGRGADAAR